jgi:hypothetical protein
MKTPLSTRKVVFLYFFSGSSLNKKNEITPDKSAAPMMIMALASEGISEYPLPSIQFATTATINMMGIIMMILRFKVPHPLVL